MTLRPSDARLLRELTASTRVPAVVARMGWTGLGVVRSLARHGVPVVVVDVRPRDPSTYTRLCRTLVADGEAGFWPLLVEVGSELAAARPVLILTSDHDVLSASHRRRELADAFRFELPEPAALRRLIDKLAFREFARDHGLPVPTTAVVRSAGDWAGILQEGRFPLVIKPKHRSLTWLASDAPKVFRVGSRRELEALLPTLGGLESDFVVQEWIPGPDSVVYFHLSYYDADHRPLLGFTGRKLRQWPLDVGSTSAAVPAESREVDELASRVLTLGELRGFGSVEFKWDERDHRMKIIEPTVGRPNLQEEVAAANGLNFAYFAYCHLTGLELPTVRTGDGRTCGWFLLEADFRSYRARRRAGELRLREFLSSYRVGRYYGDLSFRDPGPFAVAMLGVVTRGCRRAIRSRWAQIRLWSARVRPRGP